MEEKRRESSFLSPSAESSGYGEPSTAADSTISRRRGGGLKRKASNSSASPASAPPSKRAYRDKANAPLPLHQIHNGPLTRARQLSDSAATSSSLASEKNEPLQAAQVPRQESEELSAARKAFEALEAAVESEVEAIRSRDGNAHVVPVPAGWFSWTSIHPIEKHSLPSFFNGKSESRSPEMYMEIRNWIMDKFHTNPSANIETKDLSEMSVGELEAQKEIMEFLDYWGLINYHPFPLQDCDSTNAAANADHDNAEKMDLGSLIEKLYQFETEQSYPLPIPAANLSAPATAAGLLHESAIAEELGKQEGPSVEYHCNSCSADCSRKRYHCQKQADFDLCSECYNNGKFGSDMSPSDFILMEFAEVSSASGGRWTDQETLLLLEALELFKENWNEIAEHVATKTKAQCILHFLQMPIEDNFLDCDDEAKDSLHEKADPKTTISDTSEDPNSAKAEAVVDNDSTKNDSSVPKDASKISENRNGSIENQPTPNPMEISKTEDAPSAKISKEVGNEFAIKALKEAFEAVGSLPSPEGAEDKLSFAEAGNPVMSLAAFLIRLVDPGITSASVRSSLKSVASNSPEMPLALRHSFLLEDPPNSEKEQNGSGSAAPKEVDQDTQNEENQRKEDMGEMKQTEENFTVQNKNSTRNSDPPGSHEKQEESSKKSHTTEKTDENAGDELGRSKIANESKTSGSSKDQAADATKESSENLASSVDPSSGHGQQGEVASTIECPKSKEAPEDVNMEAAPEISMVEDGTKTGDDHTNDAKSGFQKSTETKDNQNVDKLKRAAVTTLAAAAVKAKLLADQEEDEIKEIAALLIEKQLRKLEIKLSFFADMDNAIMRVKEQLDRSKQMLYHERAQIIAARFGIPPSSSRPLLSMLPGGRGAMGPSNRMMRPPMNVPSVRPPMPRPIMTSGPMTSVAAVAPTAAGGSSMQLSSQ